MPSVALTPALPPLAVLPGVATGAALVLMLVTTMVWAALVLVPLVVGLRMWRPLGGLLHLAPPPRPPLRRRLTGGVLVLLALWISPAWQWPVSAWAADRDLERFAALEGAGRDEVLAKTGVDIARSAADDGLPMIVRDVWHWYAPLSVRRVELISLEGDHLLHARPD